MNRNLIFGLFLITALASCYLSLGCAHRAGPGEYEMLASLCESQCPTAHILALRACDEIAEESPWRQVCVNQADRALELCPRLCDRIRKHGPLTEPEPVPAPEVPTELGSPERIEL